ncbi:hypothetical protein ACGVWS_06560 [Enterobacteriaceae bacterium LUAb1]
MRNWITVAVAFPYVPDPRSSFLPLFQSHPISIILLTVIKSSGHHPHHDWAMRIPGLLAAILPGPVADLVFSARSAA